MGSPSYASPEQIQGQAAGPSSDVFSLGIVAWELLAGEHPFPGEGRARLRSIVEGSRRELKVRGLPSGTSELLRTMLEAHPFKRPSAAKVAQALGHLLRPHNLLRWAALDLAKSLGESAFEGTVRANLGVNLQRRHKPAEAEAEYQLALALYQSVGDRLSATRTLNNLAVLERGRGDLKGAEARYLGALETVQGYGDQWGESFITNNLGDLALAQEGGLDRAKGFYRKAQALREAIGDQNGLTYTLMGLASVSQARGDVDRAEALGRQFLDQARKTQLRPMEALALYNLGELNRSAIKFKAARGFYRQSQALHQELKDAVMEAHCLAGEAECLAREGRRGMARSLLDRSRTLSTEETPYVLRAQAWLSRNEGRVEDSKTLFAKALTAARLQAPEIVRELKEAVRQEHVNQSAMRP